MRIPWAKHPGLGCGGWQRLHAGPPGRPPDQAMVFGCGSRLCKVYSSCRILAGITVMQLEQGMLLQCWLRSGGAPPAPSNLSRTSRSCRVPTRQYNCCGPFLPTADLNDAADAAASATPTPQDAPTAANTLPTAPDANAHQPTSIPEPASAPTPAPGSAPSSSSSPGSGLVVRELAGGCLCCSLSGPLGVAIAQLVRTAKPDRLLIEPSGLGHPAGGRWASAGECGRWLVKAGSHVGQPPAPLTRHDVYLCGARTCLHGTALQLPRHSHPLSTPSSMCRSAGHAGQRAPALRPQRAGSGVPGGRTGCGGGGGCAGAGGGGGGGCSPSAAVVPQHRNLPGALARRAELADTVVPRRGAIPVAWQ